MKSQRSGTVRWQRESDGLVVVTFDAEHARTNLVTARHVDDFDVLLQELRTTVGEVRGILLTSGKQSFFAGPEFLETDTPPDAGPAWDLAARFRQQLRDLETLGPPVAAALVGSALGGGFEIALAAHHRVGLDAPTVRWQLAERTMGILPAGGGTVRSARMLGMATALRETVGEGVAYTPRWALHRGLVDDLAANRGEVEAKAKAWLRHAEASGVGQRWEQDGYRVPGGVPGDPGFDAELARVREELDAATDPLTGAARREILGVILAALTEPVDTAFALETAAFNRLAPTATTAPLVFAAIKRLRDRTERGLAEADPSAARSLRTFALQNRHPLLDTFAPDQPDRVVEVPVEDGVAERDVERLVASASFYGIPVLVRVGEGSVLHDAVQGSIAEDDYADPLEAMLARTLLGRP